MTKGTPLMAVGEPDKIELVVEFLSREAVRIGRGTRFSAADMRDDTDVPRLAGGGLATRLARTIT